MKKDRKYKNRLLKLAAFLRTLPDGAFDYGNWAQRRDMREPATGKTCDTVACAMGWTPALPTFKRLGVRLLEAANGLSYEVKMRSPKTGRLVGDTWRTGRKLFGLNTYEFDFLFTKSAGIPGKRFAMLYECTAEEVATKIERFVKEGGVFSLAVGE